MLNLKRRIARWQNWWMRLFVLTVLVLTLAPVTWPWPGWVTIALMAAPFLLSLVRPPVTDREPVEVGAPVRGRWVALNSPASAVPSHGIRAYGQAYAIDILHPTEESAPGKIGWGLRTKAAEEYPTFGEPVYAVADGVVVAAEDGQRDHRARDTVPTVYYMMLIEGFFRDLGGARRILGNHLIVRHTRGGCDTYAAYAHLRRGSGLVTVGDTVHAGDLIAEVGNTGNSSEPHLHVQLMDRPQLTAAAGVPFRWSQVDIRSGDTDPTRSTGPVAETVIEGLPANGQVFTAIG